MVHSLVNRQPFFRIENQCLLEEVFGLGGEVPEFGVPGLLGVGGEGGEVLDCSRVAEEVGVFGVRGAENLEDYVSGLRDMYNWSSVEWKKSLIFLYLIPPSFFGGDIG